MKIVEFKGQTQVLGPPPDFNRPGALVECGALPIRVELLDGMPTMTSCWKPSPAEIDALAAGACITLTVFSNRHPPVAVGIEHVEVAP